MKLVKQSPLTEAVDIANHECLGNPQMTPVLSEFNEKFKPVIRVTVT